jgi:hypothetical protein
LKQKPQKTMPKKMLDIKMSDVRPVSRPFASDFQKKEKVFCYAPIRKQPTEKKKGKKQAEEKVENLKTTPFFLKFLKFSAGLSAISIIFLFGTGFAIRGMKLKDTGMVKGQSAFAELISAKDNLKNGDFRGSQVKFENAAKTLGEVSEEIDSMGSILVSATKYIPFLSKLSSASHLIEAGEDISQIGILISGMLEDLKKMGLVLEENGREDQEEKKISYLELFKSNEKKMREVSEKLKSVEKHLGQVNLDDVPEESRDKIVEMKKALPEINVVLEKLLEQEKVLVDVLGGNGPRKYLFLFQNNQEMRATGGFIGSYGLLDIFDGRVRQFFIDGIYNPDGQLKEKVVPPSPIQKISAAWSLHDSNWFPDFPRSAEKAIKFYEKTGGPTVDGVIAMTPTVMQRLLEITGPIEMEEYGVTVNKDNFIEEIQQEVEVNYDKELNQPKKILGDLAPKILDKIASNRNLNDITRTLNILLESLDERQIIVYSKNWRIEKMLSASGWSGEILETPKDYLSVINTNINGFKTDGVVDEKIFHKTEVQKDGTIIDTVTITRYHRGGDTDYEWWNKVNSNYMRVYVPKGAQLLSATGHTREFNSPPLDYGALRFHRDPQVEMEESSISIDEESGTRIYEDAGKTVFANWVYVSPKETVTVEYKYVLPFKISFDSVGGVETYSLLAQKQSGSFGSQFVSQIFYPKDFGVLWKFPEEGVEELNFSSEIAEIKMEGTLNKDQFIGLAFTYAPKN